MGVPFLSVITVALDAGQTIGLTLESVASQTLQNVEHIVIDGGSSDGTCDRVRRAAPGVRLVSGRDHGIYDAYNTGLRVARGEWLTFLNADDAWAHPGVVERLASEARAHPEVDVFHGDIDLVDAERRVTRRARFVPRHDPDDPRAAENYAGFATAQAVYTPATFLRRALLTRLGGFDATYAIAGDYELFLRAWRGGARLRPIRDVITRMRDDGLSERRPWLRAGESFRAARRHTGRTLLPLLEQLRFLVVAGLDRDAPAVTGAVRRLKRRLLPSPTGATLERP